MPNFPRSSKLHNIFNSNTAKDSCSCLPNFQQIIKRHNKKLSSQKERRTTDCNCRRKQECPMQGRCRVESSLYKCVAITNNILPKHTLAHQKPIGKHVTTTTLNPLET